MGDILTKFEDLKVLVEDIRSPFTALHNAFREDEALFELEFAEDLKLPRKFRKEAIVLPTAREVIETAVDHISPNYRSVRVPRRSPTPQATDRAQTQQFFYESLLNYLERNASVSRYRESVKHITLHGITTLKFVWVPDRLAPNKPKREDFSSVDDFKMAMTDWEYMMSEQMPYELQVLHPSELLFDLWHDVPHFGVQISKKFAYEMQEYYPEWENRKRVRPFDKVDVVEYWDRKQRCVSVNEEPAFGDGVIDHGNGDHPYLVYGSGLGNENMNHEPHRKYVGLLRYVKDILIAESRGFSVIDVILKSGAWPTRVFEGERAQEMKPVVMEYGTAVPLPPGVTVKDLSPQLPPEMLFSYMSILSSTISAAAAPRVVRGMQNPGTRTGFQHQLALSEARLRYGSLAMACENMLMGVCRKAAIYAQNRLKGAQMSVMAGARRDEFRKVSASTFQGNHAVEVKVNVAEPDEELRKQQSAIAAVAGGIMSPQTAIRRYYPDVDPEDEMGKILAARLLFSGNVMAMLGQGAMMELAEKLGLESELAMLMQQQAGGEQAAGGGLAAGRTPAKLDNPMERARSMEAEDREGTIMAGRENL